MPGFYQSLEDVGQLMVQRTIRAFHYTRLTDDEVADFLFRGPSIDALVTLSILSSAIADALYTQSPFHSDQRDGRTGKLWMTSHPVAPGDSGVAPPS